MAATLSFAGNTLFRAGGGATGHRRRPVAAVAEAGSAVRMAPSLYDVLRVRETATAGEIKTAYRSLAKRFHPDVAGAAGCEFVEIHRAYSTLADPAARASYDRSIRRVGMGLRGGISGVGSRRWETDQCW